MLIRPRPETPYLDIYPEPERTRLEALYRSLEEKWQRETRLTIAINAGFLMAAAFIIGIAAFFIAR